MLGKTDAWSPALKKTGNGSVSLKAGCSITVAGTVYSFPTDTNIPLPTLSAGDDIAFWCLVDGSLAANKDYATPPAAGAFLIGGAHYAPGGNGSAAQDGGDTTPQFSEYSIWDVKYRPKCKDPRGMVCVNGSFWVDIYLLGVDHHINGTSRYNTTIATGTTKPKRSPMFGGNGVAVQNFNWWAAAEIMKSHGKGLLSYEEFIVAAFGVKENASRGNVGGGGGYTWTGPVTTGLSTTNYGTSNRDEKFTSIWGVIQATGVQWIWGRELAYGQFENNTGLGPSAYYDVAEGRGQLAQEGPRATRAGVFGGKFNNTVQSGSRCYDVADTVQDTSLSISARGRADHYCDLS